MLDIDKAMEILKGTETVYGHLRGIGDYEICSTSELGELLEKIQKRELVEVTHCIDCEYNGDTNKCWVCILCQHSPETVCAKSFDYCSRGKKREDILPWREEQYNKHFGK